MQQPALFVSHGAPNLAMLEDHPSEDHLSPPFVAIGAAGDEWGQLLHRSSMYGAIMMDMYGFGTKAGSLSQLHVP